jgi:protein-tyrosine phosphatase
VTAVERRVSLEGPVNFRDLGGYRTSDGRRVRWRRLYRSDCLSSLTVADLESLRLLGVRTVCDLRRDEERDENPSRVVGEEGIDLVPLPIGGLSAETRTIATRMMRGEIEELSAARMGEIYLELLEEYPRVWREVVERAASEVSLPLVVHCTAGKDRTGVASALILAALGVEEADIVADYGLSHDLYSAALIARVRPRLEAKGVEFGKVENYFAASAGVMRATLAGIGDRYGGAERYLTERAGLAQARLDSLLEQLLE